jgi:hypothetical protein
MAAMETRSCLLCVPLVLAPACGSTAPATDSPASHALAVPADLAPDAARIADDVRWLADDAREGRRAGSPGERAASLWLAARLESLGVEPAGTDGFLQPFEVPLPAEDGGGSTLALVSPDGAPARVFEGADELVPLFCSSGSGAEGETVFVGYGIAASELGRDDYGGRDVGGRVVIVLRGTPPEEPGAAPAAEPVSAAASPHGGGAGASGSKWGSFGSLFHKVMEAKRRGAAAVLVANHGPESATLLPFDAGQTAEANLPALMVSPAVAAALVPGFDEVVAALDRGESAAPIDGPRVELRADVLREVGVATNVLGRVRGARDDRTVVIGAHFDHLGRGGPGSLERTARREIHNGADDNASGTAAVLEIARCLAGGEAPQGDVVIALWSGEELGLLGSAHWIEAPTQAREGLRANLNLDMVGRAGDGRLDVLGAGTAEPFADWLAAGGPRAGLTLSVNASGQGVGGSDHQSFLRDGIPALHFFSGVHPDYHKPSDDADKVEADGAARVAALVLELVHEIQRAPALAFVEPPAPTTPQASSASGGFRTRFGSVPEYSYTGKGLLLAGTSSGGPAERAGLLEGDVLVRIDDVVIEGIGDFMYVLNSHKPGDVVLVHYVRDGEEREVRVTLDSNELQ